MIRQILIKTAGAAGGRLAFRLTIRPEMRVLG